MTEQAHIWFSEQMIEQVLAEWQQEHPNRRLEEMAGKEFADRLLAKMKFSTAIMRQTH
jgi:hypothetical protein